MSYLSKAIAMVKAAPKTTGVILVVIILSLMGGFKPYFINKFFSDSNLACANLLTKELSWKKPRNLLYYGDGIYSERGNELVVFRCISNFGYVPDWEYGRDIIKRNKEGRVRKDLPEDDGSLVPGTPLMF